MFGRRADKIKLLTDTGRAVEISVQVPRRLVELDWVQPEDESEAKTVNRSSTVYTRKRAPSRGSRGAVRGHPGHTIAATTHFTTRIKRTVPAPSWGTGPFYFLAILGLFDNK